MIHWIIHYEVAALVLYVTLLLFVLFNRFIMTKTAKIYVFMVILALVQSSLNLVSVYTLEHPMDVPVSANYAVNVVYLISVNLTYVLYAFYFIKIIIPEYKFTRRAALLFHVPVCAVYVMIASSPWTRWIFYLDANNNYNYSYGPFYLLLYATALAYLFLTVIITIKHIKELNRTQIAAVFFYVAAIVVCIIIQRIVEGMMLTSFGTALSLILMYVALQYDLDDSDKQMGTFNSEALPKQIETALREKKSFWVISINITGFEKLNKALGFSKADEILKSIAREIMRITPNKKVFHVNGVRFTIYLEGNRAKIDEYIHKLEKCLEECIVDTGKTKNIELDYYFASLKCPEQADDLEGIMDVHNYISYQHRHEGKEKFFVVDEKVIARIHRQKAIEKAVARAIEKKDFQVYYQPIYSTVLKRIASAEALVRLIDEEVGFVAPDEFIGMAEKHGTISNIDSIVLEKVCRFYKERRLIDRGIDYVEVNLSPYECTRDDLTERVFGIMNEYGMDSKNINLEITETAANGSNEAIVKNMDKLSKLNVSFSMDDYGTGFSNTTRMVDLPFSLVKLDKSILWQAMESERAMSVLTNTVKMLHELGLEIVVEGVETKEQVEVLEKLGCQHLQGFYFSKPVPEESFLDLLART